MFLYVDGQKIAKRLSSGISKETQKVKELLEEYNATCAHINEYYCPQVICNVLQTDSDFWRSVSDSQETKGVPWDTQRDIIQAFLMMKRSEEELKLLIDAMQNILAYWSDRMKSILVAIEELQNLTDQFSIGAVSCLKQLLWEATLQHSRANDVCENMVKEDTSVLEYDSDSVSEASNSDDDDDY